MLLTLVRGKDYGLMTMSGSWRNMHVIILKKEIGFDQQHQQNNYSLGPGILLPICILQAFEQLLSHLILVQFSTPSGENQFVQAKM